MTKKEMPRCSGTMTEPMYDGFIKSALRKASTRWKPRGDCIRDARVARGMYKCDGCGKIVTASLPPPEGKKRRIKNILADHIDPVVPVTGFVSWDNVIERLFCERDGFQALCSACHKIKSLEENQLRKENK